MRRIIATIAVLTGSPLIAPAAPAQAAVIPADPGADI